MDSNAGDIAKDIADRHGQPREIDLAEEAGIADEDVGGVVETAGEEGPQHGAGVIEQEEGNAVGADFREVTEDEAVHDCGHQRIDNEPQWPQDGLLVLGDEITLDEKVDKIAVMDGFPDPKIKESAFRFKDESPVVIAHKVKILRCLFRFLW